MTGISFGDLSQAHFLQRHNSLLKAEMQTASRELTTGRVSDVTAELGGDLNELFGLDASLAKLQGFKSVNQSLTLGTGLMQTALARIDRVATDLTGVMLTAGTSVGALAVAQAASSAQDAFESTISSLNIRLGDRSVFSGVSTDQSPLPEAEVLLKAIDTAIVGRSSAQSIQAAIEGWFSSPTGFASFYKGGQP